MPAVGIWMGNTETERHTGGINCCWIGSGRSFWLPRGSTDAWDPRVEVMEQQDAEGWMNRCKTEPGAL